jgi:hypothetical protein
MTSFAYKFVAAFLIAITLLMMNICPCAMASPAAAAQNTQVMPCCKNEAPSKTPAGDHDNTACKRCCSARASEATKTAQLEAAAPQFFLFTFTPVLITIHPAPISEPNIWRYFEIFSNSPSSLLRLHCALLI